MFPGLVCRESRPRRWPQPTNWQCSLSFAGLSCHPARGCQLVVPGGPCRCQLYVVQAVSWAYGTGVRCAYDVSLVCQLWLPFVISYDDGYLCACLGPSVHHRACIWERERERERDACIWGGGGGGGAKRQRYNYYHLCITDIPD